jgi:manganese oxidase
VAIKVPIFFNDFGDHDHDGLMYCLEQNAAEIETHAKLCRSALKAIRLAIEAGFQDRVSIDVTSKLQEGIEEFFQNLNAIKHIDIKKELKPIMALSQKARATLLRTHELVRPLVIRARVGDKVEIHLENQIHQRHVGIHLIGDGYGASNDGSHVGNNKSSLVAPGETRAEPYVWDCKHEGTYVFHDIGDPDGDEDGTNAHGLFGALIVEPENTWWTNPEEPAWSGKAKMTSARENAHGLLAVDVHQKPQVTLQNLDPESKKKCPNGKKPETRCEKYTAPMQSFREFVIFIHDEPESHDPHWLEKIENPAMHVIEHPEHEPVSNAEKARREKAKKQMSQIELQMAAKKDNHNAHTGGSLMCINYRSEQMLYRERLIHKWTANGHLEKAVINEEQHHSSWLLGDPATPVLRAYIGDPVRIRLVHAGVKETHVFHLHVYEWHSDPGNPDSPLIDAISISPGCGHTIEPLFGAGNVQTVAGDVIWHCHLYPHFHMGMWGMLRTFDTLQTGKPGAFLKPGNDGYDDAYSKRRIGQYPNGSDINLLAPLPDRQPPPKPTPSKPGYPLFMAGKPYQRSPTPPWPPRDVYPRPANEDEYDYREPSKLEARAMHKHTKPGELFTSFGHPTNKTVWADNGTGRREHLVEHPELSARPHNIAVKNTMMVYNNDGWHDPDGHLFYLPEENNFKRNEFLNHPVHDAHDAHGAHKKLTAKEVKAAEKRQARLDQALASSENRHEPLFFRCQHGEVLELTLENRLGPLKTDKFDLGLPPTNPKQGHELIRPLLGKNNFLGECGLHVHLVKFDPICADGASTGWNYMSAPSMGKKMVYRWWADEEFGTIFFHDHLFANTRQRRGLFGALLVEPFGATFHDPWTDQPIFSGQQAVIKLPDGQQFREFCIGIGDWIAAYDRYGIALEPPKHLGGHDDNGIMVVNYRSSPLKERGEDSSLWFSSQKGFGAKGEPDTTIFQTHAGDPVWLRLIQGSHEEQHSFQIHGLRWNRLRQDRNSPWRNQQTIGISEAFTFKLDGPALQGDYLWKLAGVDDSWLGCWGLIRAHDPEKHLSAASNGGPIPKRLSRDNWDRIQKVRNHKNEITRKDAIIADHSKIPESAPVRKYHVVARQAEITYRDSSHPKGSLTDPFGLYFHAISMTNPDNTVVQFNTPEHQEPMVLRAIQGEKIEVTLENQLPDHVLSEPLWAAPGLDFERDEGTVIDPKERRKVTNRVSLHADMVFYDVRNSDGVTAGLNGVQHVDPGQHYTYTWYADKANTTGGSKDQPEQIGLSLLQDMADLCNHRHHGLIGALVIEPEGSQPLEVPEGANTAPANAGFAWTGSRATIINGKTRREEVVLILQDGLRLFRNGEIRADQKIDPEDIPGDPQPDGIIGLPDNEDQGQKAFNYRTALLDRAMVDSKAGNDLEFEGKFQTLEDRLEKKKFSKADFDHEKKALEADRELWITRRRNTWFQPLEPATPTFVVPAGSDVSFHLVCAADRPRNHSFTIHGHSWREYPHRGKDSPVISAEPAISSGWVRTFSFKANAEPGDYLYRSGVTKWAIAQGLWGILRVD